MKAIEVRAELVNALRLDLVGPENDSGTGALRARLPPHAGT